MAGKGRKDRMPGVVLVVSDDPVLRGLIRDLLTRERVAVVEADDPEEAVRTCRDVRPRLLVVDAIVGRPETRTMLERLPFCVQTKRPPPVLLLVGSSAPADLLDHEVVTEAITAPFAAPALVAAVRHHLGDTAQSHTRLRATSPKASSGEDD